MNILSELNKRFAGKTVRLWRAGRERPLRECASLYIEEFRPMLEREYNPTPYHYRQIPWTKDMICAVIDWDKSDFFDPHSSWSPDQPPKFMTHLMPIAIEADFFFKDNRVVAIWDHQYVSIMEVST